VSIIIPTIHGSLSVALLWQISEVVLGEESGLSLTVIQISPCPVSPPPFFPPFTIISIYVLYYDEYYF
jgi:hypothetical protein